MVQLNLIDKTKSGVDYTINHFPDGEVMIELKDLDRKKSVEVITRITSYNDLGILLQVGDILNRQGIVFDIYITYLMSARMDRVIKFSQPYSLKILANAINSLNANKVKLLDAHSEKSLYLINKSDECKPFAQTMIEQLQETDADMIICYPDAGAKSRYDGLFANLEHIYCKKQRNKEGKLVSFELNDESSLNLENRNIYVVDDLCDGGGTFLGVADLLKKHNPKTITLIITHAIQQKGIDKVSNAYNKVYITNSYKDWDKRELPSNVEVINVI